MSSNAYGFGRGRRCPFIFAISRISGSGVEAACWRAFAIRRSSAALPSAMVTVSEVVFIQAIPGRVLGGLLLLPSVHQRVDVRLADGLSHTIGHIADNLADNLRW